MSAWVDIVLETHDKAQGLDPAMQAISRRSASSRAREAVVLVTTGVVEPQVVLSAGGIPSIVRWLSTAMQRSGSDRMSLLKCIYALSSDEECASAIVASNGLKSMSSFLLKEVRNQGEAISGASAHYDDDPHGARYGRSSSADRRPADTHFSDDVYAGVIAAIAKLMVCSPVACAQAVPSKSLAVLATAAMPGNPPNRRVRGASGLAAVANWSGPRYAIDIVQTPNVVDAMAAVLTGSDRSFSPHLRRATLDGLSSMAHRAQARAILKRHGCDEIITAAARRASRNGDYDIAARGTVMAGHLSGHSVDEFGFMVASEPGSDAADDENEDARSSRSGHSAGRTPSDGRSPAERPLMRSQTGIALLRAEMIGDGHLGRSFIGKTPQSGRSERWSDGSSRRLSRARDEHGSWDELSDSRQHDSRYRRSHSEDRSDHGAVRRFQSDPDHRATPSSDYGSPGGKSHGGQDPELEARLSPAHDVQEVSPLITFSSATKKAAARDPGLAAQRKTTSQVARDMENTDIWERALTEGNPDMEREKGQYGRVRGYKQLASVPVPPHMRSRVWSRLLDLDGLRQKAPGLYASLRRYLRTKELPEDIEHTINADITRTMPLHCLFWSGGAQVGVESLGTILRCYAMHVPDVGYCQGMSSIAALLMMNSESEEDAFLMLVRFMSRYGYKNMFLPGFPQYQLWLEELRPAISAHFPSLHRRLDAENIIPELYVDKWLITALTHNFPHRLLVRLWDVMLLGGSPKVIVKSCLAVLKLSEERLMQLEFDGMMDFLVRGFADPDTGILHDIDEEVFVELARSIRMDRAPPVENGLTKRSSAARPPQMPPPQSAGGGRAKNSTRSSCFPCFARQKSE